MAETIRNAVALHDFGIEERNVTISLGVGEYQLVRIWTSFYLTLTRQCLRRKTMGKTESKH